MLDRHKISQKTFGALTAAAFIISASSGIARAQAPTSTTTPAEIQPGHPPPATTGSTGAPQTALPAPLPPSAGADTPGGAARNGVIAPPPTAGDADINRGAPAGIATTPVIPPPGSPGGNPTVIPK